MARPWYAFYPADYERKTAHLSLLEHGAYRRLMDHYYSTGNPLPTNVERLCRVCRAESTAELEAVGFVLREFFALTETGYFHERIQEEIDIAQSFSEKASKAGRASAAKRQLGANSKSTSVDAKHKLQTNRSQSQSQLHTQEEKKKENTSAAPSAQPFVLPDWVPKDSWEGFIEMRKKQRAPPTPRACKGLIVVLEKLKLEGHDPVTIIEQSTRNSWKDFFPPRKGNGHSLLFPTATIHKVA